MREVKINSGDLVYFFTSGSYAAFNLVELSLMVKERGSRPENLREEIQLLANNRGNKDNQSIVCLEF